MDAILQQTVNGLMIGSIYVLLAFGLSMIYGVLDIAHFAHGTIAIGGGYITYLMLNSFGLSFWLSIIVAMIIIGIIGLLVERLAYRKLLNAPPINSFIVSLGLLLVFENVLQYLFGADQLAIRTNYTRVFSFFGASVAEIRLYVFISSIILTIILFLFLHKSKPGKAIRATAQNKDAVVLMGVDVKKVYSMVFIIGSAIGAIAGSFIGAVFAIFPSYGAHIILKGFAVLILGGLGSIPGAVIGAYVLGLSETFGAGFISSTYKEVIAFLIMILVLVFKPEGIMGKGATKL